MQYNTKNKNLQEINQFGWTFLVVVLGFFTKKMTCEQKKTECLEHFCLINQMSNGSQKRQIFTETIDLKSPYKNLQNPTGQCEMITSFRISRLTSWPVKLHRGINPATNLYSLIRIKVPAGKESKVSCHWTGNESPRVWIFFFLSCLPGPPAAVCIITN